MVILDGFKKKKRATLRPNPIYSIKTNILFRVLSPLLSNYFLFQCLLLMFILEINPSTVVLVDKGSQSYLGMDILNFLHARWEYALG